MINNNYNSLSPFSSLSSGFLLWTMSILLKRVFVSGTK